MNQPTQAPPLTLASKDWRQVPFPVKPTKSFTHGMVTEYEVELPGNHVAILSLTATHGWEVAIIDAGGRRITRGSFGTPHDALMLLMAEYPTTNPLSAPAQPV